MKASELVDLLTTKIKSTGDLQVKLSQRHPPVEEDQELAGVMEIDLTEDDTDIAPKYLLLCDNDTFDVAHVGGA